MPVLTRTSSLFVKTLAVITKRGKHSKVPLTSSWKFPDPKDLPQVDKVTQKQIDQLERLGLVELNNEEGIRSLTEAIDSANQLHAVDTTDVEPLDTVLENMAVYLRDDNVNEGNCKSDILMNATKSEEDYFVAPPGNIPLKSAG